MNHWLVSRGHRTPHRGGGRGWRLRRKERRTSGVRRTYFEEHENERVALAVTLYEREAILLGDAARLADVDRWTMRDILREHGVELRLRLADEADVKYEAGTAEELEFADQDDEA